VAAASTIAVLATLDTKGIEADFIRKHLEGLGCGVLFVDIGVIDPPTVDPHLTRDQVADAAGTSMRSVLENPTRQQASDVMVRGASALLQGMVAQGTINGVIGLGGTQGTPNCTAIMRSLPYGFPKVMVSTMASGDVGSFVDIKDITMMFSVADILGLNPLTRRILANAAGAAYGMAKVSTQVKAEPDDRKVIGMTNLGVLTDGAMKAMAMLQERGYEVIVFHAVGSGGRAMEQLMRERLIHGVFDYAMGEISDELFGGFRAADAHRLTVAGALGLPQVICPGGAEHIGLLVEPNTIPEAWAGWTHVFHNPVVFVPRLSGEQLEQVGAEIGSRLQSTTGPAALMIPTRGVSRYSVEGGALRDAAGDEQFFNALRAHCPSQVDIVNIDAGAEDDAFIKACVKRLDAMMKA
jgi:uncharacterized protein (UPF0261 family)